MTADDAARFVRRAGVSVTRELIDQFDADVRRFSSDYLRQPPYVVFRPLAALRGEVFGIIERYPRPEYLTDLYRIAGRVSALLAHASSDLGQPYAADSHARTAWICADLAGDRHLSAYIRWVQANVAYWRGDYHDAIQISRDGQAFAGNSDDRLRLSSQEARACAAIRDEHGAVRALADAADLRSSLSAEAPGRGVFYFGAGKAAYYASEARLSLGGETNHRQAIRDAEESLELLATFEHENSVELTAAARLDLVAGRLASRDLDGAAEGLDPVLQLPGESRTVPIVGRVSDIHRALTDPAFAGLSLATDMSERLVLFKEVSATRELPQIPNPPRLGELD
ncbi:hypothetical protein BJF78_35510 [Pseudonocardia sp. CNS-139]|nr:hypothetical protein BJF78_35510 [Pseudonocardia sp. CNS-139]